MKNIDPIVKDVRSAREKLFSMHDEDLNKLLDYYQEQEKLDKERLVKSKNEKHSKNPGIGAA
jgi:hypothetical protein